MLFIKICLFVAAVVLLYRGWLSYQADPKAFKTALAVKLLATCLSITRFVFHIAKGVVVFILGLIYAISPIDGIPDIILGLGQIDDILIVMSTAGYLGKKIFVFPKINC